MRLAPGCLLIWPNQQAPLAEREATVTDWPLAARLIVLPFPESEDPETQINWSCGSCPMTAGVMPEKVNWLSLYCPSR